MLEKYRDAIEKLAPEQRRLIIDQLGLAGYPQYIYDVLEASGRSQADVVLALIRDESQASLRAAETLMGCPIKRCPTGLRNAPPEKSLYARAQWALGLLGPEPTPPSDLRRVVMLARNPRLPTTPSFQRFRLLKIGMTVAQFLSRGGSRRDVREWTREGSVVLSGS